MRPVFFLSFYTCSPSPPLAQFGWCSRTRKDILGWRHCPRRSLPCGPRSANSDRGSFAQWHDQRAVEKLLWRHRWTGLAIEKAWRPIVGRPGRSRARLLRNAFKDQLICHAAGSTPPRQTALAAIASLAHKLPKSNLNSQGNPSQNRPTAQERLATGYLFQPTGKPAEAQATAALGPDPGQFEDPVKVGRGDITLIEHKSENVDLRWRALTSKAPVVGIITRRGARVGAIASGASGPLVYEI